MGVAPRRRRDGRTEVKRYSAGLVRPQATDAEFAIARIDLHLWMVVAAPL
jgi:hypothetical protein